MQKDELITVTELRRLSTSSDSYSTTSDQRLLEDVEAQIPLQPSGEDEDRIEHEYNESPLPLSELVTIGKCSTAYLDGLRGTAALCVFTQHYMGGGDQHRGFGENGHFHFISLPFVRVFWSGGSAAVAIFFVLSGFVVSQSSLKLFHLGERQKFKISLLSALLRRPIRLYLPCLGTSIIIALLKHVPGHIYPELVWTPVRSSIGAELINLFYTFCKYFNPFQYHGWSMGIFEYNFILWTIPMELKGSVLVYALTALSCFGMVSSFWSVVLLSCMVIFLLHIAWWNSACFIAGLMLAIIHVSGLDATYIFFHLRPWMKSLAMHLIFFLGFYWISEPSSDGHPEWSSDTPGWHFLHSQIPRAYDKDNYYRFWHSYGSILVVYATMHLRLLQGLFNTPPFQYLGRISFMLYVVHYPIMMMVDPFMRVFGRIGFGSEPQPGDNLLKIPDSGPLGLNLQWDVAWVLMLSVVLIVAHLCTIVFDEPSVRLGKWMIRKLGLSPATK